MGKNVHHNSTLKKQQEKRIKCGIICSQLIRLSNELFGHFDHPGYENYEFTTFPRTFVCWHVISLPRHQVHILCVDLRPVYYIAHDMIYYVVYLRD